MQYSIKEIFPTIQGEGSLCGTPAIFVRMAGCNLWSGREDFRSRGIGECSAWCDTDFYKGTRKSEIDITKEIKSYTDSWKTLHPLVVVTGGEPFLQLSNKRMDLIDEFIIEGFNIAVETNGTILNEASDLLSELGHITLSPKALKANISDIDHIKLRKCCDLKIVVPTPLPIENLLRSIKYNNLFFQPKDVGDKGLGNVELALRLSEAYNGRISIQSHKMVGLR
jgi:organic radical activating enzyme